MLYFLPVDIISAKSSAYNRKHTMNKEKSTENKLAGATDMTSGPVMRHILTFAVPMLIGYVFQQFYSMVDTVIVGKFVGVYALAGVGSTSAISFMIIGFCTGLCAGFSIPVSQHFGAGSFSRMRKFIANSIWISAVFAVFITIIVCALTGNILHAMNTQADIYDYAYDYIFIVFAGIPATILYNLSSSIIRAFGDSKTPVWFLLLSSVLNIILDLVTIIYFNMGVVGAALATIFSQFVSGALCTIYMYKRFSFIRCSREELRPRRSYIKQLLYMGVPMGIQYTITAIGSVILQTAVNGLGYMAVAAVTAGNKVRTFFCTPYDALGSTIATFAGQNVGAHRLDRVREGLKCSAIIGCVYSVLGLLLMVLLGDPLSLLFLDSAETDIIAMTKFFLIADAAFGIALTCVNVFRFCMQGLGFSALAIFAGILEMIGRSFVGFVLVPVFGFTAACFAAPAAWVLADLFLIPACFYCIRKAAKAFNN